MPSAASRKVPMTKEVIDSLTALGKLQCCFDCALFPEIISTS